MTQILKVLRFIRIYGLGRTWFKVSGRLRTGRRGISIKPFCKLNKDIGVIGCGQFAFATIGYYIRSRYGRRFGACYDIDKTASDSFASFHNVPVQAVMAEALISNATLDLIYIASNHASHTEYAIQCIEAGKRVYLEKPISVTNDQLVRLANTIRNCPIEQIYFGYNRPFSRVIFDLRSFVGTRTSPITLNCFISGHMLESAHWYRNPEEGTRICGNVGHWLDLAVHILLWGDMPDCWKIQLAYSNPQARDDDMSIALTSESGDLINIVLTARCEPFEGINETINFQHDTTICKIDDFRKMSVWQNEKLIKKRYWPKDVGHRDAILQPFSDTYKRDRDEVITSSILMLHIADMVKKNITCSDFSFSKQRISIGLTD